MLTALSIQNIVLIEQLQLEVGAGLTVLTGETGAGKSILLDALGLVLGARAETGLIRSSASTASVTAAFQFPAGHPALVLCAAQDLSVEDELVVRRVITADGKSKAYLNDQLTSVGFLKQLGGLLVEIQGQFDTHALLDPAQHCIILDRFAKCEALLAKTASAYQTWQAAVKALVDLEANAAKAAAEQANLAEQLKELNELSPQEGEFAQLEQQRSQLQHVEKIVTAASTAYALIGGEDGVLSPLGKAYRQLEKVVALYPAKLQPPFVALEQALSAAQDAESYLADLEGDEDLSQAALRVAEERYHALKTMAKRYQVAPEELPQHWAQIKASLQLVGDYDTQLSAATLAAAKAEQAYLKCAEDLTTKRRQAAAELVRHVQAELPQLKLEQAELKVEVTPLALAQAKSTGLDQVSFAVRTNAGMGFGALHKVASGGELARLMLALKLVLQDSAAPPTLIFDEVDTGIGGATAAAVGERLQRLAQSTQVLVVTHSPQVAARGRTHWQIAKTTQKDGTRTAVAVLDAPARRLEIARMLAGAAITPAALDAADSLLNDAA